MMTPAGTDIMMHDATGDPNGPLLLAMPSPAAAMVTPYIMENNTAALILEEQAQVQTQVTLAVQAAVQVQVAAAVQQQMAAAAVLVEAVSVVTHQLQVEQDILTQLEDQEKEPLRAILQANPVRISSNNDDIAAVRRTLAQLDQLIEACASCPQNHQGRAPGFWTMDQPQSMTAWTENATLPAYQTMHCTKASHKELPLPSPAAAKRVYDQARLAVQERLDFLILKQQKENQMLTFSTHCSCIATWYPEIVAVRYIVNQVMEQTMVQEASEYLTHNENFHVPTWSASYNINQTPNAAEPLRYSQYSSPVQLISNRDRYMELVVSALLAARHSVIISTCYLFYQDPASLYILLDILPYIAKERGIQVCFLMDLFVFESNMLSSAFQVDRPSKVDTAPKSKAPPGTVTETSFFDCLPANSPTPSHPTFASQYDIFDTLLQYSNTIPTMEMRFWCARDATTGYRIKNHSKGIVVDDQWAVFGGSNLTPTVSSATTDLDCIVHGDAAKAVGDSFWKLWQAMDGSSSLSRPPAAPYNPALFAVENMPDGSTSTKNAGMVAECSLSILQSTPGSKGEDAIYRGVLERVESAETSITINMGHCCIPPSFVDALDRAVARGVQKIQIVVNSYHSCDLRTGQRDLFLSIQKLLQQVPLVEVYATSYHQEKGSRPDFLHGKYVIVDGTWAALGSWNLWTRSSFYELELEAFIDSPQVATILQAKFDKDRVENAVRVSLEDCQPASTFCPKGCNLCRGFGPFF